MKKLVVKTFLVAAMLLLSGIASSAALTSGKCGKNLTWTLDDAGTLTITGSGEMYNYYADENERWERELIKNLVIGDEVTSIGVNMFSNSQLTTVSFGKGIRKIQRHSFIGCQKLKEIYIPASVSDIEQRIFMNCPALSVIKVAPENSKYDSRNNCNAIIEKATNKLHFGTAFSTIPNTVTSIGTSAFYNNVNMKSRVLPNTIKTIEDHAFGDCEALERVFIPASVTSIGNEVFSNCPSLRDLEVDEANKVYDSRDYCNAIIKTKTNELIYGCSSTLIPENVTTIASGAFFGSKYLTAVYIPASVTNIVGNPFRDCSAVTEIRVASGNTTYDSRGDCNAIIKRATNELVIGCENTVFPKDVTTVGAEAFNGIGAPANLILPEGLTTIGENAFRKAEVTAIYLPASVNTIGVSAFAYNSNVKELVVAATTPPTAGRTAFWGFPTRTIKVYVPQGTAEIYKAKKEWMDFKNYIEESRYGKCGNSANWLLLNGELHITGTGAMYEYSNVVAERDWGEVNTVNIGEGITEVGAYAFLDDKIIKKVSFPSTLTAIGKKAFYRCSDMEYIWIPKSVTNIDDQAFSGCYSAKLIYVEDDNTVYDSRNNCNAIIKTADNELLYGNPATVIPNTVTSIGAHAFSYCSNLTKMTIPGSVTGIQRAAFYQTSLKELYVEAIEPPVCEVSPFLGVNVAECRLYVPKVSIEKYKAAKYWKDFIILAGVDDITADDSGVAVRTVGRDITISGAPVDALVEVYNTAGMTIYSGNAKTVSAPASGLYIVRVAGTTHKVAVK